MGFFDIFSTKNRESLDEASKIFAKRDSTIKSEIDLKRRYGEGVEDFSQLASGFGVFGSNEIAGFNSFYKKYLDSSFKNEVEKLSEYRSMARYPEISEVIEDIVYESTQKDINGDIIKLHIVDSDLESNENIVKNLYDEFDNLFYKRIDIPRKLDELFYTYYVDGKVYFEIIVDESKPKKGITGIKKLPTETMDFSWNPISGKFNFFIQYFKTQGKLPKSIEEAMKKHDLIAFYPKQIGYIDYGQYGMGGKKDVIGYLEKARQPYNQLKLLETSIVIYRLVRAPERLVFKIDTGNMPISKAMKFTEEMKQKLQRKVSYDPSTGNMTNSPNVLSMLENFFLPTSCLTLDTGISLLDGRELSLSNVIKEFNEGKKNYVYSVDRQTGDIKFGEIEWAGITKRNQKIVRVHLDNDKFVDATLDHKFILRNGEYCEAQNLKPGYSLMSLYKNVEFKNNYVVNHKVVKIEFLEDVQDVGCLTIKDPGDNHNFALSVGIFVKNSDGRGSSIESVGGNPSGFAELDDLYYFQRKLYRALKYPLSRIESVNEKQSSNVIFSSNSGDIARDETKWGRFLKKTQDKFCDALLDVFLLHLDFVGLATEYGITKAKLNISMQAPNNYIQQMQQNEIDQKWANYDKSNHEEFSKYWRMKKYLGMTDEEIRENSEGLKKDIELGLTPSDDSY